MGIALPDGQKGGAAPEKREVRIGFIALTDCAPVIVAAAKGFDRKHGIRILPSREASWAAVRDKLLSGEHDAAHVLYGLIYGVHLGIGSARRDMAIAMGLSRNGQGISLSNKLRARGVSDGASLARLIAAEPGLHTFAHTFPTGTHAMWLYYWLATLGIHPLRDVRTTTVPPPQMVAQMRAGKMDGYCVGEPWNARAIVDKIGFSAINSQDIWPDHPGKALGMTAEFIDRHPHTARAVTAALLDAARWCDAEGNRAELAHLIAGRNVLDTDVSVIEGRLRGDYEDGLGRRWQDPHYLRYFDDGAVNHPWLSDGMWFLTQYRRWGMLRDAPDYLAVARQVNRLDLYREACVQVGITAPDAVLRRSVLIDGKVWDGSDPAGYAESFTIAA